MSIEEKILDEFLGFRSYVSHTLCKNRFFLYLRSPDETMAFKALSEPSVWPILKAEIQSLFDLGPKLYGIACPAVFVEEKARITKSMEQTDLLEKDGSRTLRDLVEQAENIRNILENIPNKFLEEELNIDVDIIRTYLKGQTTDGLEEEIRNFIVHEIIPLVELQGDKSLMIDDNTRRYWELFPSIMFLIRKCIIAAILEDRDDDFMSDIKDIMYSLIRCDLSALSELSSITTS